MINIKIFGAVHKYSICGCRWEWCNTAQSLLIITNNNPILHRLPDTVMPLTSAYFPCRARHYIHEQWQQKDQVSSLEVHNFNPFWHNIKMDSISYSMQLPVSHYDSRPVHMRFGMEEVALQQVFSEYFGFPCPYPSHNASYTFTYPLTMLHNLSN